MYGINLNSKNGFYTGSYINIEDYSLAFISFPRNKLKMVLKRRRRGTQ
jgi:hypothetical protein